MLKWLIIVPIAIASFIVGLSFYLQPNDFIGCQQQPLGTDGKCQKADAIVVVSGGDTNARTDAGIELYKNGWANTLVLSGAAQDKTGLSNAAAMRIRALGAGVPRDAIMIDELAETTEQNAANTTSLFAKEGFESVILVTSGYHQRRASLEFDKRADGVQILNHPVVNDNDWSVWWWATPRGWWLAGGELIKITAFYVTGAAQ